MLRMRNWYFGGSLKNLTFTGGDYFGSHKHHQTFGILLEAAQKGTMTNVDTRRYE